MGLDVGEIVGIEVELARRHILALGLGVGEVGVGEPRSLGVAGIGLDAVDLATTIIERRQDDRRAELPLVDELVRAAVIGIDADGGAGIAKLLLDAGVEIILPLGERRRIGQPRGSRGAGIVELDDARRRHELEWRGREIACIAGVNCRRRRRLPHDVGARAELMLRAIALIVIEPPADVERERGQQLPLILDIDALRRLGLRAVVGDIDRLIIEVTELVDDREDGRRGPAGAAVMLEQAAEPDRVRVRQPVGAVDLAAERHVFLEGILRLAVEQQLAEHIGRVFQRRVTPEDRGLDAELAAIMEEGELAKAGALALTLVEIVGEEVAAAIHFVGSVRRQPAWVRDLKLLVGEAADERDAVLAIDDMIDVTEELDLIGLVVDRGRRAVDAFDAQLVVPIVAREEIVG